MLLVSTTAKVYLPIIDLLSRQYTAINMLKNGIVAQRHA
jgi:hypothetical protein